MTDKNAIQKDTPEQARAWADELEGAKLRMYNGKQFLQTDEEFRRMTLYLKLPDAKRNGN